MENLGMNKEQEIMALTLSILRLCPLYLKYEYKKARVEFEWDKPNNSVTVKYYHHDLLCYTVVAHVYKESDTAKVRLTYHPLSDATGEETWAALKGTTVMMDFYQLMGVITRAVWQNNREETDCDRIAVRDY